MPYVDLRVHPGVTPAQAAVLARDITNALADTAGKRRAVTAVRIEDARAALWTIGAEACTQTTAFLDVKITTGTNTREEKAALVARLHHSLVATLGALAEASYVVIHELPAENWGYSGHTQAARAGARP